MSRIAILGLLLALVLAAVLGPSLWSAPADVVPGAQEPDAAETPAPKAVETVAREVAADRTPPPAAAHHGPWIAGRVLDATSGRPVAGAAVRAVIQGGAPLPATRTGTDGGFRAASAPFDRTAVLEVRHDDYLPLDEPLLPTLQGEQGDIDGLRLQLHPEAAGARLIGVVRDAATGAAVADAAVRAFPVPDAGPPDRGSHGPQGKTDARGRFALAGLAPVPHHVQVEAPRHVTLHRSGVEVQRGATVDLGVLQLAAQARGNLHGVVVHAVHHTPLTDADIRLRSEDEGRSRETTSEDGGKFAFEDLPVGRYSLRVRWRSAEVFEVVRVVAQGGRQVRVEIPAGPHHLVGRVVCAGRGLPAIDIGLDPATAHAGAGWRALTDTEGGFRFDDLPPGPYALTLTRDRPYDVIEVSGIAADREDVVLEFPEPRAQVEVRGVVRSIDDAPVEGVILSTSQEPPLKARTRSDAAGRFRLQVQPERGTSMSLYATHPDYLPATHGVRPDRATGKPVELEFVLVPRDRAGALRLVARSGTTPVAGAFVNAIAQRQGRVMRFGRTDSQGELLVTGLPAGEVRVFVRHSAFLPIDVTAQVVAGETQRLELTTGRREVATRTVRILDATGQPADGVHVSTWDKNSAGVSDGVTRHGDCALPLARAATLSCEAAGYPRQEARLEVPESGVVTLRMRRGTGAVRGRVRDADGRPLDGLEISLDEAQGDGLRVQAFVVSDAEGRFAFEHLPPGRYTLGSYTLQLSRPVQVGATAVEAELRAAR